jgi:D-alanine-D-alanine ligase
MKEKDLRIIFLAKFAPNTGEDYPLVTEESDGIYAQYHYDIYQILKSICPKTVCCHDVNFLFENSSSYNYVFTLLNRAPYRNSEIFVSALLEYLNIPYLGARPNIRALAEDKHLAKMAAKYAGLNTPEWITIDADDTISFKQPFAGPYFVKPRFGASSAYIDESSISSYWEDAREKIMDLQRHGIDVIVEKFVNGIFYSVPVYFNDSVAIHLPSIKEKSTLKGNVVTYRQKRKLDSGLTRTINLDRTLEAELVRQSDAFLKLITPIDYTRIDFMVTSKTIEFIEFNVCCNLGRQSAFCISANNVGLSQTDLVTQILRNSLKRQKLIC